MPQSRMRSVGLEGPTESIAGAYVANDHDAEGISLGAFGTRQWDSAPLMRKRQSKAKHRVVVSEAGPCGFWLSRSRATKDTVCWVVAPSCMPTKAGDRVTTDRRDARQLARLMCSGDRTPVAVPAVDEEAMRDLRRAREKTLRDLQAATRRRNACVLRHARRAPGRATWRPAHLRWRSAVVGPTPAQPSVWPAYVQPVPAQRARRGRLALKRHAQGPTWR